MSSNYRILTLFLFIALSFYYTEAQEFKHINITIAQDSIDELESHPFTNEDVHGDFTIDGVTYNDIEIHYRGAFYLLNLINQGSLRNWKIKFEKENKLENRREWNFNYENYIRQNLAYHVFRQLEVPVISSENVLLSVNNQLQGLYLKYEDPDNKDWLEEVFGNKDGDLYKAAFDVPGQPKFFADLTYLGDNSSDYFLHYRKQTNKDGPDEFDYTSIRLFTALINQTPDEDFEQTILDFFDVEEFITYLVGANFMAHWDGYPFRPKNYFLYYNPADLKWHFIPWDLDGTFQNYGNRNSIRNDGSIFHYFDGIAPYNNTPTEPLARPLLWRIMDIPLFRDKYCYEYQKAIDNYLNSDYLFGIIDSISAGVSNNSGGMELNEFNIDVSQVRNFINARFQNVSSELNGCQILEDPFNPITGLDPLEEIHLKVYPNPVAHSVIVETVGMRIEEPLFRLTDLLGKTFILSDIDHIENNKFKINTSHLAPGTYFLTLNNNARQFVKKIVIVK